MWLNSERRVDVIPFPQPRRTSLSLLVIRIPTALHTIQTAKFAVSENSQTANSAEIICSQSVVFAVAEVGNTEAQTW